MAATEEGVGPRVIDGEPLRLLRSLNRAGPAEILPMLARAIGKIAPVGSLVLYLADLEEERLDPWPPDPAASPSLISDGPLGLAYRTGSTQRWSDAGRTTIGAVISTRRDRVGILCAQADGPEDRTMVRAVEDAATALGYLIAAADRWTDAFHVARRRRRMTLPAEIQWSLLPLATFASDDIELSGTLEPAYDVGGDAFDYACGSDVATIGLFDAMGHGLASARLSSLAVAAFRNARRRGEDLAAQARFLHDEVARRFETEGFVTGLLVEISLGSPERSRIVRAGHPPPILQRGGGAESLDPSTGRGVPFGIPYGEEPSPGSLELAPGDRLVLYSDGVVDARPDGGEHLGIAALAEHLREVRSLPAREATRRIVREVRNHRNADLLDDATVLIVDLLG